MQIKHISATWIFEDFQWAILYMEKHGGKKKPVNIYLQLVPSQFPVIVLAYGSVV